MRISDAKPGDVLRDKDGALWVRGKKHALCLFEPRDGDSGDKDNMGGEPVRLKETEQFGPFVRLVPEKEENGGK